ncbi:hypothetical protein FHW69_002467 [Luteibacter sp. Sphag1AF]|uniref:hypothetical protein n=1 Tax=Luteibacter sp. Sphag1AF TaxID=2587031 RepID=UPI00160D0AE9|nr:hypothetical protein [Luteibacter sp. Sphag1AF]MBB3227835.1 hypothetical protein [Luteibacter sp. Sphag1AF]
MTNSLFDVAAFLRRIANGEIDALAPLTRVVPTETWELGLTFGEDDDRLFDSRSLRSKKGYERLAYPNHFKHLTWTHDLVRWSKDETVTAAWLHEHSQPMTEQHRERLSLRLGYANRAPTAQDQNHHVYYVYLAPFAEKLFVAGESIGGGHAERGGAIALTPEELLAWPDWQQHLVLSDAAWAVPIVEANAGMPALLADMLVKEVCAREKGRD